MRRTIVTAVVLASLAPAAAHAEQAPPARPGPGWYGHHIAVFDAGALAITGLGVHLLFEYQDCECEEVGSMYLVMLGTGAYLFGGPILHHEHRRPAALVTSAALRIGLPLGGLALASSRDASTRWTVAATLGGAATAMVLDWTLLAHDRRAPPPAPVAPYLTPLPGGAAVGLAGAF